VRTFEYRGFDGAGIASRGLVEADGTKEARALLAARGIFTERLTPAGSSKSSGSDRHSFRRPSVRSTVYREAASLLRAGLPLIRALDLLIDSPELRDCRRLLAGVRDRVKEGADPVRALAEAGGLSLFESSFLDAGRRVGALDVGLDRAAAHLEEGCRIRDRLLATAVYPVVVGVLAMVVAVVLLGILLPAFARIWQESGVSLPLITRMMLAVGRAMRWGVPLGCFALGFVWLLVRRRTVSAEFRMTVDRRLFRFPWIGRARSALVSMRFARTVSLLLNSGVQLLEAMDLAGRASGSPWVEARVGEEIETIRHGGRLSDALRRIPPLSVHLPGWAEAGETGGDLPAMLNAAANRSSEVWERLLSRGLSLLEPVLFILLGGFVFLIALAVMLPILSLNRGLGL